MNIQQNSPLVYIIFAAPINQKTTDSFINALVACSVCNVQKVIVLFSSPGGNVQNGFTIYNILKGVNYDMEIYNVGNVDSVSTLIFLGVSKRFGTANSTFMFHGIGFDIENERFEEIKIREKLNSIESDKKRMCQEYIKNTSLTEKEINEYFNTTKNMNSIEALEKGIIQEVRNISITNSVPIIHIQS